MKQSLSPHFENDSDAERFIEDSIVEYKSYLNKKNIYLEDNIEYDKYFLAIYLLFTIIFITTLQYFPAQLLALHLQIDK